MGADGLTVDGAREGRDDGLADGDVKQRFLDASEQNWKLLKQRVRPQATVLDGDAEHRPVEALKLESEGH